MNEAKYKYTILKNHDGKYWLWFDERGTIVEGKYVPNLQPYHEIDTRSILREGAEIWTDDLESVPNVCQLRPLGEYSDKYVVKARIKNEHAFLAVAPNTGSVKIDGAFPVGKRPGMGKD